MKDKKILIAILVALLGVCCVLSLVLGFVFKDKIKEKTSDNTATEEEAEKKEPESSEDKQDLMKKIAESNDPEEMKGMSLKGSIDTVQSGITLKFNLDMEVDGENVSMVMYKDGGTKVYWIVIGKTTYLSNDPDKGWYELPESEAGAEETTPFSTDEITGFEEAFKNPENLKEGEDYEYLGTEKCGDLFCHKMKINQDGQSVIAYFDVDDLKLRRIEMDEPNQKGSFDISYGNTTVEKPSNVQTLSDEEAFVKIFEILGPLFQ